MIGPGGVAGQQTPVRLRTLLVFLNPERALLHERIADRCEAMLKAGLREEVQALMADGCPANAKPMQAIGYREVASHAADLAGAITVATRQYAKRQITWFKGAGPDQTVSSLAEYKSAIATLCAGEYDVG